MKTPHLTAAILSGLSASALAAIPVSGTMDYTQDFNVLATATNTSTSLSSWTNDSTIPGWYLYKAGPTQAGLVATPYTYRVSNGEPGLGNTLADTGHFYSMGVLNDPERGLGAVSITGQGEHSIIAVFQNTSGRRVRLTNIAYNAEVWRTNQNINVVETINVSWRKNTSATAFFTNTTAAADATAWPAALSTGPSGQYVTGWNQLPAAYYTYTSPVANVRIDPALSTAVNTPPGQEILLEAGEYLAVRWGNINDSGADAIMGIDDAVLSFTAEDTGVSAEVTNVTRMENATTRNPADDTVSATINAVSATGGVTWIITDPPSLAGRTGSFGTPEVLANLPIADFSSPAHAITVTLADTANAAASATVQIVAPWCQITAQPATNFTYDDKGTVSALDDEVTYILNVDGSYTGADANISPPGVAGLYGLPNTITMPAPGGGTTHTFTDAADPACTAILNVFPPGIIGTDETTGNSVPLLSEPIASGNPVLWTINGDNRLLIQSGNPVQLDHTVRSRVLDLSAVGVTRFTATLSAIAGTSSGFEAQDSIAVDLIIDGGAPISVFTAAQDTDSSGRLTGTTELPAGVGVTRTYQLSYLIPDTAVSVQLVVTGNSNSTSETFNLSAVRFGPPLPEMTVSAPSNITRNPNGDPGAADDTVSFDLNIAGQFGGTGWVATGALPVSGPFGINTLTVPAGLRSATVRISDDTYSEIFTDVTVALPGPYIIGALAPSTPIYAADIPAADPQWVVSGVPPILTFNGLNVTAPAKTVTSENVTLPPGSAWRVSANLHVNDRTGGFEPEDYFNAYLILDGNFASPRPMITALDADSSGLLEGAELCPVPAVNPTVQDFDYPLSAIVPAGTATVQIVITGLVNSTNETMTLSSLLIAPYAGVVDSDGDGVSDGDETIMGTSPIDGNDVLRLSVSSTGITFPSVPGRFYQLYASSATAGQEATHLQQWLRYGTSVSGDGNPLTIPVTPDAGTPRRFFRLHVSESDGPWPD